MKRGDISMQCQSCVWSDDGKRCDKLCVEMMKDMKITTTNCQSCVYYKTSCNGNKEDEICEDYVFNPTYNLRVATSDWPDICHKCEHQEEDCFPDSNTACKYFEQIRNEVKGPTKMTVTWGLSGDSVNHPSHYTQGGVECIDGIRASMPAAGFQDYCKGNVLKYVWRWRDKGGIEDLAKAQVYLSWLIESAEKEGKVND